MNPSDMLRLARELMDKHDLTVERGWRVKTNRSKRTAGTAQRGLITLSVPLLIEGSATYEDVVDTILHEIAHCLVGPGNGHNLKWRNKCIEIGGTGRARHNIKAHHRYNGVCSCGKKFNRDAKSERMTTLICRSCHTRIEWTDSNTGAVLNPQRPTVYQALAGLVAASAPTPQPRVVVSPAAARLCTSCFTIKAANGTCNC